jgi:hypothetical protein
MYWNTHADGSMTRKLVEDWSDEERALDARHKAFLKEADALGYTFRLNTDTLTWVGDLCELRRLEAVNAQLLEALKKIAAIENQMYGLDWEEIDEARGIARAAIAAAKGEA